MGNHKRSHPSELLQFLSSVSHTALRFDYPVDTHSSGNMTTANIISLTINFNTTLKYFFDQRDLNRDSDTQLPSG